MGQIPTPTNLLEKIYKGICCISGKLNDQDDNTQVLSKECLCVPESEPLFEEGVDGSWEASIDATFQPVEDFSSVIPASYPLGITTSSGFYDHRDGVSGPPLSGVQRTIKAENPIMQNGASLAQSGIETIGGGTTTGNAIIHSLTSPASSWGSDLLDIESASGFLDAVVEFYDGAWNLLDTFTLGNGEDIVVSVGYSRPTNDISYVRVIVGDANGGSLSDQLALTNVRVGRAEDDSSGSCDVTKFTLLTNGLISTSYVDANGSEITDQSVINSLVTCGNATVESSIDYEYLTKPYCTDGMQVYQVIGFVDNVSVGSIGWLDANGDITTTPANPISGICENTSHDYEDQIVCSNGESYIRRNYIVTTPDAGSMTSTDFIDSSGASVNLTSYEYGACTINTHVISGCVTVDGEPVNAFTIVDNAGNPLFAPKPLSELGFGECCN